jgi:hypothetical protein
MLRSQVRGSHGLLVAALCLVFFLQCLFASRTKSPTFDEPIHIVSGASYIATGKISANLQHPPLVKELAGLSLALAGIRWKGPAEQRGGWEWDAASSFLTDAGVDRALFWARLPMLLLAPLLGLLIYFWAREVAGRRAGVFALFLFAADPTMVAHSYLVTTDTAVASFSLLFLLALYRYLQSPGTGRLLCAGITLGLALCVKFSAIFLVPVAAVLLIVGAPQFDRTRPRIGFAVRALAAMGLVSVVVIQVLYFIWRGPAIYLRGLHRVNGDHVSGFLFYLAGQLKTRFVSYFAVAWLLKEPLATVALTLVGTVLTVRSRKIARLTKFFLLLPPAVFFLACTLGADDIGIRYEIPALVFGYLIGGIALAALSTGRAFERAAAVAACAWVAMAAAGIYPDHLSYFNEAACLPNHADRIGLDGGSRCGTEWLADSNIDWGQSLPQLKTWLDGHAAGRAVKLMYFGFLPPEAYGIHFDPDAKIMVPLPPRGLYAISAHCVAYGLADPRLDWLREEPAAVVGHAYYIFDIDY